MEEDTTTQQLMVFTCLLREGLFVCSAFAYATGYRHTNRCMADDRPVHQQGAETSDHKRERRIRGIRAEAITQATAVANINRPCTRRRQHQGAATIGQVISWTTTVRPLLRTTGLPKILPR
eukprot:7471115-Pyramimonas_sp.AAC.1